MYRKGVEWDGMLLEGGYGNARTKIWITGHKMVTAERMNSQYFSYCYL